MSRADLPVLRGWGTDDGHVVVWCEHCERYHFHGGDGHRSAHCRKPGSPYAEGGYIVRNAGRLSAAMERNLRRWHPLGIIRGGSSVHAAE